MRDSNEHISDILVIGTGIAGLTAAIYAAEAGFKVNLISKGMLEDTNTYLAQGGIIYEKKDYDLLIEDILRAGDGLSLYESVKVLAKEGAKYIDDLLIKKAKIEFTRGIDGMLDFTAEAAHSKRRIIHSADATGKAIEQGLLKLIKKDKNIETFKNHIAVELISLQYHTKERLSIYREPEVIGAYIFDIKAKKVKIFYSKTVILATGGLGQIYKYTTNHSSATGDGIAMASRIGANIINMEYTQFHPTTLYHRLKQGFLITEALRGEGAILKTIDGEEFMQKYHNMGALAPRDIVARAIHNEMIKHNHPCVLLDIHSYMEPEKIKERFPNIYKTCIEYGVDITKSPIPVVPAFHFICGGIKVDLWGRTNIKRLFAVGETSCTGVHGANRLASTSLLEGLVWAARCIRFIKENEKIYTDFRTPETYRWEESNHKDEPDPAVINKGWRTLKDIMWNYVGLVRSTKRLKIALKELNNLRENIEEFFYHSRLNKKIIELRNGIHSAILIAKAAWRNKESIGTHYRVD